MDDNRPILIASSRGRRNRIVLVVYSNRARLDDNPDARRDRVVFNSRVRLLACNGVRDLSVRDGGRDLRVSV